MGSRLNIFKFIYPRRYFATIFAISYAIFLVIFAGIVFIGTAAENRRPVPEIETLYPVAEVSYYELLGEYDLV